MFSNHQASSALSGGKTLLRSKGVLEDDCLLFNHGLDTSFPHCFHVESSADHAACLWTRRHQCESCCPAFGVTAYETSVAVISSSSTDAFYWTYGLLRSREEIAVKQSRWYSSSYAWEIWENISLQMEVEQVRQEAVHPVRRKSIQAMADRQELENGEDDTCPKKTTERISLLEKVPGKTYKQNVGIETVVTFS